MPEPAKKGMFPHLSALWDTITLYMYVFYQNKTNKEIQPNSTEEDQGHEKKS